MMQDGINDSLSCTCTHRFVWGPRESQMLQIGDAPRYAWASVITDTRPLSTCVVMGNGTLRAWDTTVTFSRVPDRRLLVASTAELEITDPEANLLWQERVAHSYEMVLRLTPCRAPPRAVMMPLDGRALRCFPATELLPAQAEEAPVQRQ